MAMMKVFVLAATVSGVHCDNCLAASAGVYKTKTGALGTMFCNSAVSSCTTATNGCPCGSTCCTLVPGTCEAVKSSGTSCGAANFYTDTASSKITAATSATFDANCCTARAACSAHTCPAGYTDKANKATLKCSKGTCTNSECCDQTACTDCCRSVMTSGTFCPTATHYMSGNTAAATTANFEANCCTAKKTCDVTCDVAKSKKNKADYATIKCYGATCSSGECCDDDSTKCKYASGTCSTGTGKDSAKDANTATTFQTDCCTAQTTCAQFAAWVPPVASFAMLPQVHAVVLVFALGLFAAAK